MKSSQTILKPFPQGERMGDYSVDDGREEDCGPVAAIHCRSLPDSLMAALGVRFLKAYYEVLLSYPESLFVVCRSDGRVVGFVAGVQNPAGFDRHLRSSIPKLLLSALLRLTRRPRLVWRLIQKFGGEETTLEERGEDAVELDTIAVGPDWRRAGVGQDLLEAFLDRSERIGGDVVFLTTEAEDNPGPNRFYTNAGFSLDGKIQLEDGRKMNVYSLELGGGSDL